MKMKEFGKILKKKRIDKKLSQLEVALDLGYSSPQFVSNWERGKCYPSIESLPKLAKMFGFSPSEMAEMIIYVLGAKILKEMKLKKRIYVQVFD